MAWKRLDQAGEVRFITHPWGKPAYQYALPRRIVAGQRLADALAERDDLRTRAPGKRKARKNRSPSGD
ncbi:MAG: hypothetical protein A3H97_16095 [Acidobacteria bacterium RIFCSPLOWO2_02_FULL_65_29]|nr:MAG: hypothetical protein A3H97_16095 [Acidobacteria bacterium RIFCSPLOWO2_02_FULL_65_29]